MIDDIQFIAVWIAVVAVGSFVGVILLPRFFEIVARPFRRAWYKRKLSKVKRPPMPFAVNDEAQVDQFASELAAIILGREYEEPEISTVEKGDPEYDELAQHFREDSRDS